MAWCMPTEEKQVGVHTHTYLDIIQALYCIVHAKERKKKERVAGAQCAPLDPRSQWYFRV